MNNKELIKAGHARAAELKGSFEAINACSVAQLISDLASQLEVQLVRSNELAAKLSMINGLMDAAEQANKLAQEATEKLVQERDALAAENAGLKAAHPQPFGPVMMKALDAYEKHQDETPEIGMLDAFFILRDSIRADTTATDAFLAEVRAQGVEMFAKEMHADISGDDARDFADDLRKGVLS
ncbi:hypothetical protein [Citrobacter koseri]|uniref:hypothetical protein n=1 Tax=Citrobacter koseri TaxID=545 RepID=UPI003CFCEE0B